MSPGRTPGQNTLLEIIEAPEPILSERLSADLAVLAAAGARLRDELHFDWPRQTGQMVHVLRFLNGGGAGGRIPLVAIVGGASSGKSTVFNNLLGGHVASFVTARGHATRGAVLAVHSRWREALERLDGFPPAARELFPDLPRRISGLDAAAPGDPETLTVVLHEVESLEHAFVCDTPDLTSDASRREGDLALALLPWFDRLIIVIDAERWFDRQSIDGLHAESARLGQERLAVFNRSRAAPLAPADLDALREQSRRLAAVSMVTVNFHPGRGCRTLDPAELTEIQGFLTEPAPRRVRQLLASLAAAVERVLNANAERARRLVQLRAQIARQTERCIPSMWSCLTALMKPAEREQLTILARVLRPAHWRQWFDKQTQRFEQAVGRIPVLGALVIPGRGTSGAIPVEPARQDVGIDHFRSVSREIHHTLRQAAQASPFFQSAPLPAALGDAFVSVEARERRAAEALLHLDQALARWNARIESEAKGLSSNVVGALGATAVGVAIVLVAVQGPVAALTLPAAKAALAAALGKLLGAAGAGAAAGRPLRRFIDVTYEKLLGSPEFTAVKDSAENYRQLIVAYARGRADLIIAAAEQNVLQRGDGLRAALEGIRDGAAPL
ncbi:MAG TPA: hypothetical protein VGM03_24045 [Phycisphaerae bacterium]